MQIVTYTLFILILTLNLKVSSEELVNGLGINKTFASNAGNRKISCSEISDKLCNQLWDAEHQGTMKTPDGKIALGLSKKSNLANISTLEDCRALLAAENRLPTDLRVVAKPLFLKLRKILANENESIPWIRSFNHWDKLWDQKLIDISEERALKKYPILKKTRLSERTSKEYILINREYFKLFDEVTLAKYQNHPNWQRVERLFNSIRNFLLAEIAEFPFEPSFKDLLVDRVKTVELVLPLLDLDVFDSSKSCAEAAINANYDPNYNKITVCTGMFMSLQSEDSIYMILAHELSHSIDPASYNWILFKNKGLRTQAVQPLIGIQKAPLACNVWDKILTTLDKVKIPRKLQTQPYDTLAQCLDDGQPLKKAFDPAEIDRQVEEDLVEHLNYLSNRNLFSNMVIPNYLEFGKKRENPYFLGPEVFVTEFTGKGYSAEHTNRRKSPLSPEVFYQAVHCEYEKTKSSIPIAQFFTQSGSKDRDIILKNAMNKQKKYILNSLKKAIFLAGNIVLNS